MIINILKVGQKIIHDTNSNKKKAGMAISDIVQLCPTLCYPMDCSPWNSPGHSTGVGSLSLLQGIFLTQGSNPGLPHCRQILYQVSHKGSPRSKDISTLKIIDTLKVEGQKRIHYINFNKKKAGMAVSDIDLLLGKDIT